MKIGDEPVLISIGNFRDSRGKMGILEDHHVPFKVLRTYWISQVPENAVRGGHAHRTSEQLLICIQGVIEVLLEGLSGDKFVFKLDQSCCQGLYLPPLYWGRFTFSNQAVALCMASDYFDESDYIRDYQEFEQLKHANRH